MKRKAEKQQPAAPISAIAARKARQQQLQAAAPTNKPSDTEPAAEPPSKRARHSSEDEVAQQDKGTPNVQARRSSRRKEVSINAGKPTKKPEVSSKPREPLFGHQPARASEVQVSLDDGLEDENSAMEANDEDYSASLQGDVEGYESPTDGPVEVKFPLSKARLSRRTIIHGDENTACVRIKEKLSLAIIGQYDFWVKRGVVSLMGAKLHPSPRMYRVYAPSTHSLPVIKCVAGVDGEAEVEIQSCHSGIHHLKDLSPLYQRIWNGEKTSADKYTLKWCRKDARRTFSILYTSGDDSLRRHLRPLHMDAAWSSAIRELSQRSARLRVMVCGPKGSGKSTFSRYLLNHLLSPAPHTDTGYSNTDGVAFLDLDPGQPEFSPMGQVYLAHLRSPVFGPPFTHPSLDDSSDGTIIRAHHIGATSPKDDADHYVLAAMDLMDRYRALLATYPQCPLIVNYPGWIFGLGLEVATWAVRSLGLSDVIYMSDKGPFEVVQPLALAAHDAKVPLTTLRSQPTDFVSRSSAQLRSMQMQSYFHMSRPSGVRNPQWLETPISRIRPIRVDYAGPQQGIRGIMVMGSQISPDLLHDVLDGAVVGVVAVESPNPIIGQTDTDLSAGLQPENEIPEDGTEVNGEVPEVNMVDSSSPSLESNIVRTAGEDLPYLFAGSGSCNPLDPKTSHSLGLALVRSINIPSRKLELVTPIPTSKILGAAQNGHGIILVRGQLDNPNWAISEEYHSAKEAEKRHQQAISDAKKKGDAADESGASLDEQMKLSAVLRDRTRRASTVPWMKVVDESQKQQQAANREKSLWKLRKRAYPGSESEMD